MPSEDNIGIAPESPEPAECAEAEPSAFPPRVARNGLDEERMGILAKVEGASSARELTDLTNLFNVNLAKTEMARAGRQSELLDKVLERAGERIEGNPDALTDKDLLGYINAFQSGIERAKASFNRDIQATPTVLVSHNEVNLRVDGGGTSLGRDSRERVMNAVKGILAQLSANRSEADAASVVDVDGDVQDDEGTAEDKDI